MELKFTITDSSTAFPFAGKELSVAEAINLAVASQLNGDCQRAIELYNLLIDRFPASAEFLNSRGIAFQSLKRHAEAIESYDLAIALNPDFPEAHFNRGVTLQITGRLIEALDEYRRTLELNPNHFVALRYQGLTFQALSRFEEAVVSYNASLEGRPDHADTFYNRGTAYQAMGNYDWALQSYEHAIALDAGHALAFNNRGAVQMEIKQFAEALKSFDAARSLRPSFAEALNNRGNALLAMGDLVGSREAYLKALHVKTGYSGPLLGLSSIGTYTCADHPDVEMIQDALTQGDLRLEDRDRLHFALGKIYDDCGLFEQAFKQFQAANEMRRSAVAYSSQAQETLFETLKTVFSPAFLDQPLSEPQRGPAPLFVLGMPRSGTTLIAKILASHSLIQYAGELPNLRRVTEEIQLLTKSPNSYPESARDLTHEVAISLSNGFRNRLRRDFSPGVFHVIDKHPLNFFHIGLISVLFPEARIVHVQRDPLDCCLSNYFQRLSPTYAYSFDLADIGSYYRRYLGLMDYWKSVLPGKIIGVRYEDVILETESTIRNLIDSLNLDWNERCLLPHEEPGFVDTASQWQVRQPMYRSSIGKWRHYDEHLQVLKDILAYCPSSLEGPSW
jgi:tetratricopeptide (TPR) repeat protein